MADPMESQLILLALVAFTIGALFGAGFIVLAQLRIIESDVAPAQKDHPLPVGEKAPMLEPFYPTPERFAEHMAAKKNKGPWSKEA